MPANGHFYIFVVALFLGGAAAGFSLDEESYRYKKYKYGTTDERVQVLRSISADKSLTRGAAKEKKLAMEMYRAALKSRDQKLILAATDGLVFQNQQLLNAEITATLRRFIHRDKDHVKLIIRLTGNCGSLKIREVKDDLLSLYRRTSDKTIQKSVLEEIGKIAPPGDPAVYRFLLKVYNDIPYSAKRMDMEMKISALFSMGHLGHPAAYQCAKEALTDASIKSLKTAAVYTLGKSKNPKAVEILLTESEKPNHFTVKRNILQALTELKAKETRDKLMEAMRDNLAEMRIYGVRLSAKLDERLDLEILNMLEYKADNDTSFRVKKSAAETLLEIYEDLVKKSRALREAAAAEDKAPQKKISEKRSEERKTDKSADSGILKNKKPSISEKNKSGKVADQKSLKKNADPPAGSKLTRKTQTAGKQQALRKPSPKQKGDLKRYAKLREHILKIFAVKNYPFIAKDLEKILAYQVPRGERALAFNALMNHKKDKDAALLKKIKSLVAAGKHDNEGWTKLLIEAGEKKNHDAGNMLFLIYESEFGKDKLLTHLVNLLIHDRYPVRVEAILEMDRRRIGLITEYLTAVMINDEIMALKKPASRFHVSYTGKNKDKIKGPIPQETDDFMNTLFMYLAKYNEKLTPKQVKRVQKYIEKTGDPEYRKKAEAILAAMKKG